MPLRLRRGTDAVRQTITPVEGELIYVTDTTEIWVGDGSTLGGLLVTSEIPSSVGDLDDVDLTVGVSVGDFLAWDGANFIPINIVGNIEGRTIQANIEDTLNNPVVDYASSTHYGTFIGELVGDVVGSVFADDSTRIINGEDGSIEITLIQPRNGTLDINSALGGQTRVELNSTNDRALLKLTRNTSIDLTGDTESQYGAILFERDDINGPLATSIIWGRENSIYFGNSANGDLSSADKYFVWKNNKLGIGITDPQEMLDVVGNINASGQITGAAIQGTFVLDDSTIIIDGITGNISSPGNITASGLVTGAAIQGTFVLDDSTIIIDGIEGNITAPGFIQFGNFTTVERNALTAANGMVVYNTTANRFQGYQNSAWVNLDDGTAA